MSGQDLPASKGTYYSRVVLGEQIGVRVIPTDINTGSVLIKSFAGDEDQIGNKGTIYVGFDDEVDEETGFPIEPGEGVGLEIQNRSQGVWVYPEVPGDQVRVIATN